MVVTDGQMDKERQRYSGNITTDSCTDNHTNVQSDGQTLDVWTVPHNTTSTLQKKLSMRK